MVHSQILTSSRLDLLLIGEEGKRHYILIKDFNTFMYDHTLHRRRKHFCRYCSQAFNTEEIIKRHINNCFKINGKQRFIMPKKASMLNSKIMRVTIIMSPFMIYADFESLLVPEHNGRQNLNANNANNLYGYAMSKFLRTSVLK